MKKYEPSAVALFVRSYAMADGEGAYMDAIRAQFRKEDELWRQKERRKRARREAARIKRWALAERHREDTKNEGGAP